MAHPPPGAFSGDGNPDNRNPDNRNPDDRSSDDDLAAFDFGAAADDTGETDLGAILGGYGSETGAADDESDADAMAAFTVPGEWDADDDATPTFTVTNPPGTVTVTTFLDGRVQRVDLAPTTVSMAEAEVAEEIVVIAALATQDARSAQYTVMLDGMREQGHDNAATRDFLNRDLDLPTPEQAAAARTELFTTRYAGER